MKHTLRALGVCLLLASAAAGQDEATVTTAREVARQGLEAYDAGRYEEAADKLGRAFQVVKVPTLALHAARAFAKVGRLVDASEAYLRATRLPASGEFQAEQEQARKDAARERAKLMPRIPTLVVEIEGADPADVEVTVDGKTVPLALLGAGHLVDPGKRKLEGKHGDQSAVSEITFAEGEKKTVTLQFGEQAAVATSDADVATETPAEVPSSSDPVADTASDDSMQRTLGWVGIGVGGAGLLLGAITGIMVGAKKSDLDDGGCTDNHCYEDQSDDIDSYNSLRTVSTVGFVVGVVAGAAGVTLLLTAPDEPGTGPEVQAFLGAGTVGVAGRF